MTNEERQKWMEVQAKKQSKKQMERQWEMKMEKLEQEAFMRGYEYAISILQESVIKIKKEDGQSSD